MRYFQHHVSSLLVALLTLGLFGLGTGCASSSQSARPGDAAGDEVEVGYGTQDRGSIAGAVAEVDGDEARNRRAPDNLADLLEGNVAGVTVNRTAGGIQVRIRGTNSINGSNEPLYVVDGMPVEPGPGGVLHAVNPFDVESITVLKDAASTSIYGARGGNGVIIIKTKSQ